MILWSGLVMANPEKGEKAYNDWIVIVKSDADGIDVFKLNEDCLVLSTAILRRKSIVKG